MDFQIVRDLPPVLSKDDWIAIDLELFGAVKHKLHRPTTGTFAMLSFCASNDPSKVYVLADSSQVAQALENIKDASWVFHNASFDLTHLRRWATIKPRKKIWDTMLIDMNMWGGLYSAGGTSSDDDNREKGQFSLKDLARRYLDIKLDKAIVKTFENSNSLSDEQISYGASDSFYTLKICEAQQKEITKNSYKIWTDVDRGALWAMLDFKGFPIDVDGWKSLAESNKARSEEIKASMEINPASPVQVKKALSASGFKRLKDTLEKTLKNAILKYPDCEAVELAKQVMKYRMYAKRASTYGLNFIEDHVEIEDGVPVIHAGYWVIGTEHGRTSSNNPNMQNIIARDTKDFRKCFIARPEHKLVIVDMGQQETRIGAYISQDKQLIKILQDKEQDVFVGMAQMVYKRKVEKSDPFRKQVKNTTYGIFYGMTPEGLSERYNMSLEDAEIAIQKVFNAFPELYSWITQQQKKRDYVETIAGRRIWLNQYSDQVERNAVNHVISGSAADQMKTALGRIHKLWPFSFEFACVGYVHDELIFDVPEKYAQATADFVIPILVGTAEEMCPSVPFTASYVIADNWSEKE